MRACLRIASLLVIWLGTWAAPAPAAQELVPTALPALPDTPGLGGPFAGLLDGELVVLGGANFPDAPPWEGGKKVWHRAGYRLDAESQQWQPLPALPAPRAYGASVTVEGGLVLLGGSDEAVVYGDAWWLRPTKTAPGWVLEELPALPVNTAFCTAASFRSEIYLAVGKASKDDADLAHGFYRLDLEQLELGWVRLPDWPGPPRLKAVSFVQSVGSRGPAFHLVGGEQVQRDANGALRRGPLQDAWRYVIATGTWEAFSAPPQVVMAGAATARGDAHALVWGGARPVDASIPQQEHPGFSRMIQAYHTITDRWTVAGAMPESVVTGAVVPRAEDVVLVSGEIRPGVRTAAVHSFAATPSTQRLATMDGVVLVLYLGALVWLGAWFSRRGKGTDDFFLAGGRVPWWAAGISLYATQLSAITYLATPAVAFAGDWRILPALAMILAVAPIVVRYYLPFYRRLGITTAYEYLERRFDHRVRLYGSAAFVLFQVGRMAVVVYLPALALAAVTGFDLRWSILAMGVLATVYTVLGGIEAVIWTDVLQAAVLVGGVILALVLAISGLEQPAQFFAAAAAEGKFNLVAGGWSFTALATWSILLGSFLLNLGPYTTDQAVVQRYLTTKDERSAARGIWLNGLISLPFGALFFLLGTALYRHYRENPAALELGMMRDEIFPLFVVQQFPVGLAGLLVAGVFAASMSSLDSSMHSIATAWTTDFQRKLRPGRDDAYYLRVARRVTVLAGVIGTSGALVLASFDIASLFFLFQEILGLLTSGLVGVFLLGIFTRRASANAVLVGALTGTAALWWIGHAGLIHFYLYPVVGIGTTVIVGAALSMAAPHRGALAGLTWWDRPGVKS